MTTPTKFEAWATGLQNLRYSHLLRGQHETWDQMVRRVCYFTIGKGRSERIKIPKDIVREIEQVIIQRKFIPGGRILANTGRDYHQTNNCVTMKGVNTREGWGKVIGDMTTIFMSGAGIGCDFSELSPYGTPLKRSGGIASGPIPLIKLGNAAAEASRQGGERRGAFYASLKWDHQDIEEFIKLKEKGGLDNTNISVRFDNVWHDAIELQDNYYTHQKALQVFQKTLYHACKYGDPGFQFDWDAQILRNACTEIISDTPYDPCCLGSLNLAKISSLSELSDVAQLGVIFLLANTEYSHDPVKEVTEVKERNRRLGLGIMGLAEWFIQRDLPYGFVNQMSLRHQDSMESLQSWMAVYKGASDSAADKWSSEWGFAKPVAVRAIAPTGTISIVGGRTTSGIEPITSLAHKRTYNTLKEQEQHHGLREEVVIEPIISKLLEEGYSEKDLEGIDTAYSLSSSLEGIERRLSLQAFIQNYVDNGISSTINLPKYQEGIEERIAPILLKYLPKLRGVTFYPDGARANQPIQPIGLKDALETGTLEESESCRSGICGL